MYLDLDMHQTIARRFHRQIHVMAGIGVDGQSGLAISQLVRLGEGGLEGTAEVGLPGPDHGRPVIQAEVMACGLHKYAARRWATRTGHAKTPCPVQGGGDPVNLILKGLPFA